MEENKIPEISLKLIKIENPHTEKSKIVKVYKYSLWHNFSSILTDNWFVYIFYKVWWKIKPPKFKCYYGEGIEKAIQDAILKEIESKDKDAIL